MVTEHQELQADDFTDCMQSACSTVSLRTALIFIKSKEKENQAKLISYKHKSL